MSGPCEDLAAESISIGRLDLNAVDVEAKSENLAESVLNGVVKFMMVWLWSGEGAGTARA